MKDTLQLFGQVTIQVHDKDGNLEQEVIKDNLIVTGGKGLIADRLISNDTLVPSYIRIGSSSQTAALADTTLISHQAAAAVTSTVINGDTAQYTALFSPGNPATAISIEEAGLFNLQTGGVMISRLLTGTITKTVTSSVTLIWTLKVNG
jgi:hypothetical protein